MENTDRAKARLAAIATQLPYKVAAAAEVLKEVEQLKKEQEDLNNVLALASLKEAQAALENKLSGITTEGAANTASGNKKGWRRYLPHKKVR